MSIANGGEGSPPAIPREIVTNDYWLLADIEADSEHVRYWRVKRTSVVPARCPLMTQSGHFCFACVAPKTRLNPLKPDFWEA